MAPFLKNHTITVLYPIEDFTKIDWTRAKIEKWIETQGGTHLTQLTDATTHIVCSEKAWAEQVPAVRKALEAKEEGRKIAVVSPLWLENTLRESKKAREGPYLWEKLAGRSSKGKMRMEDAIPKSTSGLMAQVFHESADQFVSPEEKKRVQRQIDLDAKMARQVAAAEEKEREVKRREAREAEMMFKKGAKKARNEIFSDNHHIYTDSTGFKYDIMLTKVDTKANRNERLALTIYETNTLPPTYATNLHSAGTRKTPSNNVIAAIGCNFHTAFRVFRKTFREKTGVEWEERVAFAVERAKREKRAKGLATGSPEGTQRGRPVSEEVESEEEALFVPEEVAFRDRVFLYHPPLYGPRGEMREMTREVFPEVGPSILEEGKGGEDVRVWMEGMKAGGGDEFIAGAAAEQDDAEMEADGGISAETVEGGGNDFVPVATAEHADTEIGTDVGIPAETMVEGGNYVIPGATAEHDDTEMATGDDDFVGESTAVQGGEETQTQGPAGFNLDEFFSGVIESAGEPQSEAQGDEYLDTSYPFDTGVQNAGRNDGDADVSAFADTAQRDDAETGVNPQDLNLLGEGETQSYAHTQVAENMHHDFMGMMEKGGAVPRAVEDASTGASEQLAVELQGGAEGEQI